MTSRQPGTGVLLATALLIGVLAAGLQLMWFAQQTGNPTDEAEIKRVVEEGFLLRGEACLTVNMTRTQEFQIALADYWSHAPAAGATLEARQTEWTREYPTIEATSQAAYYATAIAEGVITGSLESWLAIPEVTPMWFPESSPLEIQQARVEECHEYHLSRSGTPIGFGVDELTYNSIDIDGDDAHVEVEIDFYTDYEFPDTTVDHRAGSYVFDFYLVREGASWRMTGETRDQWGHG